MRKANQVSKFMRERRGAEAQGIVADQVTLKSVLREEVTQRT